ncbi:MAG: hypothetical protein WBX11_00940 [Thiobacillaceae bacterium]
MALQLLGIWTVWHDLTTTAREFGKDDVFCSTWDWLKGFFGRRHTVIGALSGKFAIVGAKARVKQRQPIDASLALPGRVAALEKLAKQIDDEVDAAYRELDQLAAALDQKIKDESGEREEAVNGVRGLVKSTTTGNYPVLLFGAAWLAVGVILATLAPELAKVAAGQGIEVWKAL